MDIYEMIKNFKLGEEGEDKSGFEKEFREAFKHKSEIEKRQKEIETLTAQMKELNQVVKKFDGVDVEGLKKNLDENKIKYEQELKQVRLDYALDMELMKNNPRNIKAVKALLNMDIVKMDGDSLKGLQEQLEDLKKSDDYLFQAESTPVFTGVTPKAPEENTSTQSNGALFAQEYNSTLGTLE